MFLVLFSILNIFLTFFILYIVKWLKYKKRGGDLQDNVRETEKNKDTITVYIYIYVGKGGRGKFEE